MAAYAIVQVDIQDAELFESYRRQVPAIIKQFGGRYLARGGSYEVLCGHWPVERTIILEFPSLAQARAWHEGPEYAGPRAIRDAAAKVSCVIFEGINPDELR